LKSYDDILIHHAKHPVHAVEREFHAPWEGSTGAQSGYIEHRNRSCGDVVRLWWRTENGVIADVFHHASGCMLCKASASILCEAVRGVAQERIPELVQAVERITLKTAADDQAKVPSELGGRLAKSQPTKPETPVGGSEPMRLQTPVSESVQALSQVRDFPTRRKCITLAWEALAASVPVD